MAKWKVWNKHPHGFTHREKFRDDWIEIKANDFVVMDYEDANQFRGQYFPMKKDAMGAQDPSGFKCIFIEPLDPKNPHDETKKFICNYDGKEFVTEKALEDYILANHSDKVVKDDALDEEIKRRPGRPFKEKTA